VAQSVDFGACQQHTVWLNGGEKGGKNCSMEAIAADAGVAVETIYATFGSNSAVLSRLVDVSVVGDEEPVPLLDRQGPQAVMHERDQHRQIQWFAHDICEIMGRMSPIFEIMRIAAKTEPDIAAYLQHLLQDRLNGMAQFIQSMLNNGPLREGLSSSTATDTVWALTSAEIYRLLIVDRGWSANQYETWLGESLIVLLLP